MPERTERNFAGKASAFHAGYERMTDLNYDIIGNVDADVTFEEDYISFLLSRFCENSRLDIAGTPFTEGSQRYDYRFTSIEHVSGACQLFRRKCFEDIGGYAPLKAGGIDLAAVLSARMKGWQTRTFIEKTYEHHKKTQAGKHSNRVTIFKSGYHDYLMGSRLLWQILRSCYQMTKTPFVVGGSLLLAGYLWAMFMRADHTVPRDLVIFRRKEQMQRIRDFLKKRFMPCIAF
jgi:GT2 family glycosyltransferase